MTAFISRSVIASKSEARNNPLRGPREVYTSYNLRCSGNPLGKQRFSTRKSPVDEPGDSPVVAANWPCLLDFEETLRRIEFNIPDELHQYIAERAAGDGVPKSEVMRRMLQTAMDIALLGEPERFRYKTTPGDIVFRSYEILLKIQHLYEATLRKRGDEGEAVVEEATNIARQHLAELVER